MTVDINNESGLDADNSGLIRLAAFALGLVLFLITMVLNLIALRVVRRYREAYE